MGDCGSVPKLNGAQEKKVRRSIFMFFSPRPTPETILRYVRNLVVLHSLHHRVYLEPIRATL